MDEYIKKAKEFYEEIKNDLSSTNSSLFLTDRENIILLASFMKYVDQRLQGANLSEKIIKTEEYGRQPYTEVSCAWFFEADDVDAGLTEMNEILKNLPSEWKPHETYFKDIEELVFSGDVKLDEEEFQAFKDGDKFSIRIKYSNNLNQWLSFEIDLEQYDEEKYAPKVYFGLVSYHPEFIQGVSSLELDFLPKTKKNLVDVLNHLYKQMEIDEDPWTSEDIEAKKGADWFEIIEFDEEKDDENEEEDE